jgi:hypothetical protein
MAKARLLPRILVPLLEEVEEPEELKLTPRAHPRQAHLRALEELLQLPLRVLS